MTDKPEEFNSTSAAEVTAPSARLAPVLITPAPPACQACGAPTTFIGSTTLTIRLYSCLACQLVTAGLP